MKIVLLAILNLVVRELMDVIRDSHSKLDKEYTYLEERNRRLHSVTKKNRPHVVFTMSGDSDKSLVLVNRHQQRVPPSTTCARVLVSSDLLPQPSSDYALSPSASITSPYSSVIDRCPGLTVTIPPQPPSLAHLITPKSV